MAVPALLQPDGNPSFAKCEPDKFCHRHKFHPKTV